MTAILVDKYDWGKKTFLKIFPEKKHKTPKIGLRWGAYKIFYQNS